VGSLIEPAPVTSRQGLPCRSAISRRFWHALPALTARLPRRAKNLAQVVTDHLERRLPAPSMSARAEYLRNTPRRRGCGSGRRSEPERDHREHAIRETWCV